jgi:phage tail-like protein
MPITADKRTSVTGRYGLELGGAQTGWVNSVEGGDAVGEVVTEEPGADYVVRKHIARAKYEDVSLSFGTGMSNSLYQWIKETLERQNSRKDGAVISADYNYREQSRISFYQALITEVGFPALDAGSKDVARMTLKLAPEYTQRAVAGTGAMAKGAVNGKLQEKWLPSNFRLKIDGLNCTKVSKVGELVVKQGVVEDPVGELREYQKRPAHLDIPNLTVTMAESGAQDFHAWHDDFVVKGNNDPSREKSGTLEFLTPNLTQALFTLSFRNLGIFRLSSEASTAGSESVRRVTAELYCEEMSFAYRAGWA